MAFFIIEGVFVDPCPVDQATFEKSIQEHLAYLENSFQNGSILVSGPKAGGGGGFIIMKAESEEEIFDFFDGDPMKLLGVQNYIVNEFSVYKSTQLCDWFTA